MSQLTSLKFYGQTVLLLANYFWHSYCWYAEPTFHETKKILLRIGISVGTDSNLIVYAKQICLVQTLRYSLSFSGPHIGRTSHTWIMVADYVLIFEIVLGSWGAFIFGQYMQHSHNSFCVSGKGQIGATSVLCLFLTRMSPSHCKNKSQQKNHLSLSLVTPDKCSGQSLFIKQYINKLYVSAVPWYKQKLIN